MKIVRRAEQLVWHEGAESVKLLHLSDLHVKWKGRSLRHVETAIHQSAPDLIAMTGDYYDTPWGAGPLLDFVKRVAQHCPVYWISGNHDRWFGAGPLRQLRQVGRCYCVDDQAWIYRSRTGRSYELISWAQHRLDSHPPRPGQRRIVLLHNPEHITTERLPGCDLLLAGHLHGAQFIFRQCADGRFFPGNLLYRWCGDRHQVGAATVIVSRGLGDTLPLRFRCPKEMVFVEIR
jgi:uncharacterized protein